MRAADTNRESALELKLGEGLLAGLALRHLEGVEPHGLAQGPALAHSHRVSNLTKRDMVNILSYDL